MLTEITDGDFDEKITRAAASSAILFSSAYCGTCKKVAARMEFLAGNYGKINFFKLDITNGPQKAGQYQIMHLPTLVFLKGNNELDRLSGDISENNIKDGLEKLI
jgi:thioredoxin-like negative regulator of GroEL